MDKRTQARTPLEDGRVIPLTELEARPLTGTLPVRPFADRFYGTVFHDGQRTRVAALCCEQPEPAEDTPGLVLLSLVGASTSGSAALAQLADGKDVLFEPAADLPWSGPRTLRRLLARNYRQVTRPLPGVTEWHFLAFPLGMHLEDALLNPPELPEPEQDDGAGATEGAVEGREEAEAKPPPGPRLTVKDGKLSAAALVSPRYLLGNQDEPAPHRLAFLGHLVGLRIVFVPRWTDQLWALGLANGLITPLEALGVKAWRLSGNLGMWSLMISSEVQSGRLLA